VYLDFGKFTETSIRNNTSQVNFPEKKVRITFNPEGTTLKKIVELLCSIGYEPYISLENFDEGKKVIDRSLIYKIGVAFFLFWKHYVALLSRIF
jgi:P-type Cu+ transporter